MMWSRKTMLRLGLLGLLAMAMPACSCNGASGGHPVSPDEGELPAEADAARDAWLPEPDAAVDASVAEADTLIAALRSRPDLTGFTALIERAQLQASLGEAVARTVFAPTNRALQTLSGACVSQIQGDNDVLDLFARHHVGKGLGGLTEAGLRELEGLEIVMASNWWATVQLREGVVFLDDVPVGERIEAGSGAVFILDVAPLIPEELGARGAAACLADG